MAITKYNLKGVDEVSIQKYVKTIILEDEQGKSIKLEGEYHYSDLLTENIILAHFEEFKAQPWESYLKYFVSPTNIYPMKSVHALTTRDKKAQVDLRNDLVMDALLLGNTPEMLNMKTYDSIIHRDYEKKLKTGRR